MVGELLRLCRVSLLRRRGLKKRRNVAVIWNPKQINLNRIYMQQVSVKTYRVRLTIMDTWLFIGFCSHYQSLCPLSHPQAACLPFTTVMFLWLLVTLQDQYEIRGPQQTQTLCAGKLADLETIASCSLIPWSIHSRKCFQTLTICYINVHTA